MTGNPVKLTITFVHERETKNTVRYAEQVADPKMTPFVGTLYLRKEGVQALGNPPTLVVTIESGE
jgi:hypothetical protein